MLKKTSQRGFTIVELLIVIVVIGILAALVLNTFSGVQKRARDSQRQTDINAVSTQLEVFYNDNGHYPVATEITKDNLKGLDEGAITPPQATAPALESGTDPNDDVAALGSGSSEKYIYVCTAATEGCSGYTIYYKNEDKNNVLKKESLNKETTTP